MTDHAPPSRPVRRCAWVGCDRVTQSTSGLCREHHAAAAREEITDAIRRWVAEHGTPPRAADWETPPAGYPRRSTVLAHWPRWNDAIAAAGITPTRSKAPPIDAEVRKRIMLMRAAGTRNVDIAAALNDDGIRRPGGGVWDHDVIAKLVNEATRGRSRGKPGRRRKPTPEEAAGEVTRAVAAALTAGVPPGDLRRIVADAIHDDDQRRAEREQERRTREVLQAAAKRWPITTTPTTINELAAALAAIGLTRQAIAQEIRGVHGPLPAARRGRLPAGERERRRETILAGRAEGRSHAEIATDLGVSAATVTVEIRMMRADGIDVWPHYSRDRRPMLPPEERRRRRDAILTMGAAGATKRAIADHLGIHYGSVTWEIDTMLRDGEPVDPRLTPRH